MSERITSLLAGEFPASQTPLRAILSADERFLVVGEVITVAGLLAVRPFALLLPMPYGTQDTVLKQSPHKFFPAPRYADQGWIGIDLTQMKGEELRYYLYQAWKLVAP